MYAGKAEEKKREMREMNGGEWQRKSKNEAAWGAWDVFLHLLCL